MSHISTFKFKSTVKNVARTFKISPRIVKLCIRFVSGFCIRFVKSFKDTRCLASSPYKFKSPVPIRNSTVKFKSTNGSTNPPFKFKSPFVTDERTNKGNVQELGWNRGRRGHPEVHEIVMTFILGCGMLRRFLGWRTLSLF